MTGQLRSPQTGQPQYGKAQPTNMASTDLNGAAVALAAREKYKETDPRLSIAGVLAKKEDYEGSLRYLEEAKTIHPDRPQLDETIAYVKGLQAASSDADAMRIAKSPSPRAEILLDSLEVGKGDWQASIRYLEGMQFKKKDNPPVSEALSYVKGVYAYERAKEATAPPTAEKPLPKVPLLRTQESVEKELDQLPQNRSPRTDPIKELDDMFASFLGPVPPKPQKKERWINTPKAQELRDKIYEDDMEQMLTGFLEENKRNRSSQGMNAVMDDDFEKAAKIFEELHIDYPEDPNIRDTMNYVQGVRDADYRNR